MLARTCNLEEPPLIAFLVPLPKVYNSIPQHNVFRNWRLWELKTMSENNWFKYLDCDHNWTKSLLVPMFMLRFCHLKVAVPKRFQEKEPIVVSTSLIIPSWCLLLSHILCWKNVQRNTRGLWGFVSWPFLLQIMKSPYFFKVSVNWVVQKGTPLIYNTVVRQ